MTEHAKPEHGRNDLQGPAAVQRMRKIVDQAQTCFFCTNQPIGRSSGARPMSVRKMDDDGRLWFLSAADSDVNAEIARDASVQLYFQGSSYAGFLQLKGRARISSDRETIHELWTPLASNWFPGGKDDPNITVLEVSPSEGYYWDTEHGIAVLAVKLLLGAVLGRTMDDGVEGRISP